MIILANFENILKPHVRVILSQLLAVLAVDLFLFIHGICMGFPIILIPALSGNNTEDNFNLSEDEISWIGSINLLFIALANLLSGIGIFLIGYMRTMQLMDILFVTSCLLLKFCNAFWQVLIALSLCGFAGGLIEASIPGYVTDISQPRLRGTFLASTALAKCLGIFLTFLMGSLLKWRDIGLIVSVPPVILFCLLIFIPESPSWLLKKNKPLDAQQSLSWVRGWTSLENTESEFQELKNYLNVSTLEQSPAQSLELYPWVEGTKKYTEKRFLWPLAIIIWTIFIQNYTGIFTINIYATEIFATFQVPIDKYHAIIFLGIFEVLGSAAGSLLVHYMGKRLLNFISLISSAVCLILLGIYAYLAGIKYLTINDALTSINTETHTELSRYTWIPLLLLVFFAFVNCCGTQCLMWILMGELFSTETQSIGLAISSALFNVVAFTIVKISLTLISTLTLPGTFWLFGCTSFIGIAILYFILPETEGKTLQEISNHFLGICKLDNKVRRKTETRSTISTQVVEITHL